MSPAGSTIHLTVGRAPPTGPSSPRHRPGPGPDADQRDRAFDRFWQGTGGELGGSGLGLAIVQKLVAADGGHVELREAPGGGLDAVVQLPPVPVR